MFRLIVAAFVLTSGIIAVAQTTKFTGSSLRSEAALPLGKARSIAIAARPGRITDEELEKERGGSGLRYSFDISSHGKKYEVGVDAKTGAVLENGVETAAD